MRSQLRYFSFGGDMFGHERRKEGHIKQLRNILQRPARQTHQSRIQEIRRRKEQRQVSYSFQLRSKEMHIQKENLHFLSKLTKVNTTIPRQSLSKTCNLRSNSLREDLAPPVNVKPAISSTRRLQQQFQQQMDYGNRIKRFTVRENRPVLKMTAMIKISNPRFKRDRTASERASSIRRKQQYQSHRPAGSQEVQAKPIREQKQQQPLSNNDQQQSLKKHQPVKHIQIEKKQSRKQMPIKEVEPQKAVSPQKEQLKQDVFKEHDEKSENVKAVDNKQEAKQIKLFEQANFLTEVN